MEFEIMLPYLVIDYLFVHVVIYTYKQLLNLDGPPGIVHVARIKILMA